MAKRKSSNNSKVSSPRRYSKKKKSAIEGQMTFADIINEPAPEPRIPEYKEEVFRVCTPLESRQYWYKLKELTEFMANIAQRSGIYEHAKKAGLGQISLKKEEYRLCTDPYRQQQLKKELDNAQKIFEQKILPYSNFSKEDKENLTFEKMERLFKAFGEESKERYWEGFEKKIQVLNSATRAANLGSLDMSDNSRRNIRAAFFNAAFRNFVIENYLQPAFKEIGPEPHGEEYSPPISIDEMAKVWNSDKKLREKYLTKDAKKKEQSAVYRHQKQQS